MSGSTRKPDTLPPALSNFNAKRNRDNLDSKDYTRVVSTESGDDSALTPLAGGR